MWDCLAYLLIVLPGPDELPVPVTLPPGVAALKRVSERMELADPREHWRPSFRGELECVRMRRRHLAGAPRLAEAPWLPPHGLIQECLAFNTAYVAWLDSQMNLDGNQDRWANAKMEALWAREVWGKASWAVAPESHVYARRDALAGLRVMIGEWWWFVGALPPHVPVWRMRSVD